MKLTAFPLLTDENIDAAVVEFLRARGFDVLDVAQARLFGTSDFALLQRAFGEGRAVVTHDSDFGTLAILRGAPVVGVIYLRPGHIDPQFTIGTLEALFDAEVDVAKPFIVVARRSGATITIRVRRLDR